MVVSNSVETLSNRVESREAIAGVIGLGYVGLPLGVSIARANYPTIGFDVDDAKVTALNAGRSYIEAVGATSSPSRSARAGSGRPRISPSCAIATSSSSACRRR